MADVGNGVASGGDSSPISSPHTPPPKRSKSSTRRNRGHKYKTRKGFIEGRKRRDRGSSSSALSRDGTESTSSDSDYETAKKQKELDKIWKKSHRHSQYPGNTHQCSTPQLTMADHHRVAQSLKNLKEDQLLAVCVALGLHFFHGYKQKKAYIIAEGPMESTARNMWKVIYDRKCGAVVMLSDLLENKKESSCQYWPAASGELVKFGEYTVDLISEEVLEGFTIRTLSVLNNKKSHQVTQFHITCWRPDGQCSNLKSIMDTIEEIAKVQRRTGNKPILVHCSDTVTRSGIFCAMATVIDRCKTEGVIDVFQVVKALRVQKPGAVPTVENFMTIFEAALTFLDSFDTLQIL